MCAWASACASVCGCRCMGAGVCLRACSLNNPKYNAPSYCNLQPLWLHHISRHHLINGKIFGKQLLKLKCVFWFSLQLLYETSEILSYMWKRLYVKCPLFLSGFNEYLFFSTDFTEKLKYQISSKSGQKEPCCFMRTDGTKLWVTFRNFAISVCRHYKQHPLFPNTALADWPVKWKHNAFCEIRTQSFIYDKD